MNKALLCIMCLLLMLTSVLAFTLAFSSSSGGEADLKAGAAYASVSVKPSALYIVAPQQEATPTVEEGPVSHPGSTDGIVILSIAIVVIITLPILLQRSLWRK